MSDSPNPTGSPPPSPQAVVPYRPPFPFVRLLYAFGYGLVAWFVVHIIFVLAFVQFVPHGLLKPALQQVIRQRTEQVLHAHFAGGIRNVFGVTNAFHKNSFQLSAVSSQ